MPSVRAATICLWALLSIYLSLAAPGPALAASPDCTPPVLWGDGEHDDTLALNAWLRGETVIWADSDKEVGATISGRTFRLTDAIYVQSGTGRRLENFRLIWPERGETVSGATMLAGGDPAKPPNAAGLQIEGGDPGEGVAFEAPDPAPEDRDHPKRCLTS